MIFGKPRTGESREAFKKRVRESLIERGVFSRETGKIIGRARTALPRFTTPGEAERDDSG